MLDKLKKFKTKKCKTIFGTALQFLLFHHVTQLIILIITFLTSGVIVGYGVEGAPFWMFSYYLMWICAGIFGLLVVVGLIFVWIINPIRNKKELNDK